MDTVAAGIKRADNPGVNFQRRRFVVTIALFGIAGPIPGLARPEQEWQAYTNTAYDITFRYPRGWKPSPVYSDRIYFGGPDGSLQMDVADGDNPEQICQRDTTHKQRPYGSHPQVRAIKVQGQRACLVWPSVDQEPIAENYAELVVRYPRPVEIDGSRYRLLILNAEKKYLLQIVRSIRFLSASRP